MSATYRTILQQSDEEYAPPDQPVLEVDIVGDDVFLTISRYDETADTSTYTRLQQVHVPAADLLMALHCHLFAARSRRSIESAAGGSVKEGETQK